MRMRFKPYARAELDACPFHVKNAEENTGHWRERFARPEQPFVLELGCGKGGFIGRIAAAHPENNYLGVDITDKVLVLAKRKTEAAFKEVGETGRAPDNVLLLCANIEFISRWLAPQDTVQRIYINFCNPWSRKASSAKHRLTYPRQLLQYRQFLAPEGEIWFKTDDDDLFRDSLSYFDESGYQILWQTADLHADEPEWNIRTEHEGMFSEQGIPIKALIARIDPDPASVTWIEPRVLKRQKAAEKAAQEAAERAAVAGENGTETGEANEEGGVPDGAV